MSILVFQPDAERYYAEGYWRSGDLWGEFASRASVAAGKTALVVGEESITYEELERAGVALSARLAGSLVQRGDVVLLLGRNSIEAAVALLACFHRGAIAAPLPPMFGAAQLSALAAQAGAKALISFGGDAEIARRESLRGQIPLALALRPDDTRDLVAERPQVSRAIRSRPTSSRSLLHSSGTTSAPQGDHALEQHAPLRGRADTRALGADAAGHTLGGLRVRLCRKPGVRIPRSTHIRRHRRAAAPLERRGGIATDRAAPLLIRAIHADARRGRPSGGPRVHERLVEPPRAGRHGALGAATDRDVRSLRPSPSGRLRPIRDSGGHISHRLSEPREKIIKTEGVPFRGTQVGIVDPDGEPLPPGEVGAIVVNGPSRFLGFLANEQLTRESLTSWWLPDRRPRLSR